MTSKVNNVSTASGGGIRNGGKSSGGEGGKVGKSNPYYQMFPALANGGGGGGVTQTVLGENWARENVQNQAKWRVMKDGDQSHQEDVGDVKKQSTERRMSNDVADIGGRRGSISASVAASAVAGGDKGTNKRKNKKRRTNGE